MGNLRLVWRLVALAVWTAWASAWLVGGAVIGGVGRGGWRGPATGRWRTGWFRRWSRGVLRLLNLRVDVRGAAPTGPFYLVSNHVSYVDIPVIAAHTLSVFVAKSDVEGWPVVGTLCRMADTLFIDRTNKRDIPRVIEGIQQVRASGRGVVVFPEGSSTKGDAVLRFRPSLLESAATAGLPVSYAAVSYRTPEGSPPAHLAVCWWGDMLFGGHFLGLLRLPEVRATLVFGQDRIVERDRKELARRLQEKVEQSFEPVV